MARKASVANPDPTAIVRCESPQRVVPAAAAEAIVASLGTAVYGCQTNPASSTAGAIATMAALSRALVASVCVMVAQLSPGWRPGPEPAVDAPRPSGGHDHCARRC